jgi:teichuronic acid biosynthesis glycosyltransferase TuaC
MKISIISHNYPSERQPYLNTFIRDHYRAVSGMDGYEPELLIPTPYAIPFTERWKRNKSPLLDSHAGRRVNYLSVPSMKAPGFTSKRLSNQLLRFIPGSENRILHLHWIYPSGLTIPDLSKKGYKTVLHIHGSDWYKTIGKPGFAPLIEQSLQSAETICVSGSRLKADILERFPALQIRVLGNFIDTGQFSLPVSGTARFAKDRLRFDPEKFHFLTIANLRHEKGVDLLLDAVHKLNRSDVCFHIIGQPAEGRFAGLIETKLKKLEPGRVIIHTPVPRGELVEWYHAADAYLLPSRSEGFNVSLLEALSTGLPVIATNVGGAGQVLGQNRGILIEPEDPDKIRDAILRMIENRDEFQPEEARDFIEQNYSMEQYRRVLMEAYSGLFDSDSE